MPKSAEIQAEIDSKNAAIDKEALNGQQTNHDFIIQTRNEINVLQMQLSDAKTEEASQAERSQAQEQAVESITLPYDFNEILSDGDFKVTKANEMIIEVVRDVKRQANAEHNAEVDQIKAGYEERLKAADEREAQLQRQNSELQTNFENTNRQLSETIAEREEFSQRCKQAELDRQDAESKRDNMARQLDEANAKITRLEQITNAAGPAKIEISPTDKLAQMVKESAEQKAARGLARWNESNPSLAVAPLEFPVLPTLDSKTVEQSNPAEQVIHPSEDQIPAATTGLVDTASPVLGASTAPAEESPVTRTEFEALQQAHNAVAERVASIERHANLPLTA